MNIKIRMRNSMENNSSELKRKGNADLRPSIPFLKVAKL